MGANIVGFSGKACSGKDTLGALLVEEYNYHRVAFADGIKQVCVLLFGMAKEEEKKDRSLMQKVGEKMREIDALVWVKAPFQSVAYGERIVVTDVRFTNEFRFLKERGALLVRLECQEDERQERHKKRYGRYMTEQEEHHVSECDLDFMVDQFDLVIDTTKLKNRDEQLAAVGAIARRARQKAEEGGKPAS